MTDDLRSQLKKLDPMPPEVPTEPVTSESSRHRLEAIMSTPTIEKSQTPERRSRTPWYAAVAAVAVIAVAIGGTILATNSSDEVVAGPPLELTAGPGDAMASCLAVSAEFLVDMQVAFEGTVSAIEGEVVTLTVDRWFTEGDAATVVVTAPDGLEALIGGIDFQDGQQYLVTATDGVVNYCGYSGPSTPELTAIFETAFPGR
jgi:hypothetical protein